METPNKQNTLYLPIKQVYFDQIIAGTKKEEYREIKPTTYKKYLDCDETGDWYIDEFYTDEDLEFYGPDIIIACKDGHFPFFFKDIKFLSLAVGYEKIRDTALVELVDITPMIAKDEQGRDIRLDIGRNDRLVPVQNGRFCRAWFAVFHLGKIVEKNIVSK